VRFGIREDLRSLKSIFPDICVSDLRAYLKNIEKTFERYNKQYSSELPIHPDINKFCFEVLREDASSIQWGNFGSGVTKDFDVTFNRLFSQLVTQRSSNVESSRSDSAVWSVFSKELKKRNMLQWFQPTKLNLSGFQEELKHTYQNGALHCLKPISFDLTNEENILDKVYKTKGWHETLIENNSDKPLRFYYLVGKPLKPELAAPYMNACKLLEKDTYAILVTEEQADQLPSLINKAVNSHYIDN
jgi:hypothetical protein